MGKDRKFQAKLETALASMTDAVFISNTQGNFINFNDAFATFHKFKNKDECFKIFAEYPAILDVFMADGTPAPLDMWAVPRALRGEVGTDVEYTLRRKDTGETWIGSYSFGPIRDNDGAIVGSVVIARDITERKRMEEELLRKTEIMDAISQNSSELIFAKDCQGRLVYVSDSFLRFFSKSADEILGKTDVDLYSDPLISESVMENDRIVREKRQSLITEESVRLPDGSPRIYLSIKSPWLAKDSMLLGTMGFSVDVTERKMAEQERETTVDFFRECSGFEAVGIRLKCDEDYPYFETSGFPTEFVKLENSLCVRDASRQLIRDSNGYPIHECMCGNVICGRFDPSRPFFTTRGSFCTNCTTKLLATTTDVDLQARTRNRCNGKGYESVALIALRVGEEKLGLLQLNDRRKGLFTPEKILMWERLADYLAVAIAKVQAEESLQKAHENLQMQSEELQVQSKEIQSQNEELQVQYRKLREVYGNLQVSEIRYRGLFETVQEAFFINRLIYDEQGKVIDWIFEDLNPAGFNLLGLKDIDEVKGKRGSEILGCERAAFHFPMIERAKLLNKVVTFQYYSPYADKELLTSYVVNGDLLVTVQIDITKQKKAEMALRESEANRKVAEALEAERQRLFDVLDTLPAMVCLLTFDHHYAFTNRSFREKFGEHGNRHCYELCFGFNKPCEFCEAYKILETGQPHHWEVTVPDGSVIDVYNFPFTDVDGSPMILEMDFDITEKKNAEEELRKSERQFHALAEAMPQIVWITRADGWNIYFNQQWMDYTGLTLEESYGHGWNKPFHPADQKRAWDDWQNAVNSNGSY